MLNEARTQWLEVKKIISHWIVRDFKDLEVFMRTSVHFNNVWQPKGMELLDFDYKKISGTVSFEGGVVEVADCVDYWENEEGAVHSFEMEE